MKHSSTWFALILIASALLLSAASRNPRPNQHEKSAVKLPDPAQQQEEKEFLSVLRSSQAAFLNALRAVEDDAKAERGETRTQPETYSSPSVRIQIGLLIVGVIYSILAALQWSAINEQARFIKLTYAANRPYLIPDNFVMLNFTTQARRTDQHGIVFMTVEFALKNVGKGPAIVKRAGAKLKMLPDDPTNRRGWYPNPSDDWGDLSDCVAFALDSQVVAADGTAKGQVISNLPSEDQYLAVKVGYTEHLVVYGSLDYLDAAGEPYTAVFGRIYRPKDMLNDEHFTIGPAKYNRT